MISSSRKIRRVSDNLKLGKLIVWLWISCILVTVVSSQDNFYTNGRFGKRKETRSMSPFQSGSRFGRSEGGGVGKNAKEAPKLFEIVPRMDRFFYGSRYGKRSSSSAGAGGPPPVAAVATSPEHRGAPEIGPAAAAAALSFRRFEAAIDYLDRVKQLAKAADLAEEEEDDEDDSSNNEPSSGYARLEDARPLPPAEEDLAPYRYLFGGRSKI